MGAFVMLKDFSNLWHGIQHVLELRALGGFVMSPGLGLVDNVLYRDVYKIWRIAYALNALVS